MAGFTLFAGVGEGRPSPRQSDKREREGNIRARKEIEADGKKVEFLILETLLDLRDLLNKQGKRPRGRPRKT